VLALPATYVVKLTAGGRTYTQPLTLKMDPRATITPLGLAQQFTLATKIAAMMNRTFAAVSHAANPDDRNSALLALNTDLATAYDVVEGADRAPTTQAVKAVTQLEQRVSALLKGTP
jgi:hypothetical protein